MLTIHHLGLSQSERIIWLCEELELPYAVVRYARDPETILAPAAFKALHPAGAAPVIVDGDVVLAESGAVVDYILARYGAGRLVVGSAEPGFAAYLFWLHYANGTLQPNMGRNMVLRRLQLAADDPVLVAMWGRLERGLQLVERRLGESAFLGGPGLTAADIMTVFSLTTMRVFLPFELSGYPRILEYLQRVGGRGAYRRAMAAGEPGFAPMLG